VESLRLAVCAWAACGQVFFLCRYCDRGNRHCSRACSALARGASLRAAGARYQASPQGRRRHARRQCRYRLRQPLERKVTHQGTQPLLEPAMVSEVPVGEAMEAEVPAGKEERTHAELDPDPSGQPVRCSRCGRPGRFVRQETMACYRRNTRAPVRLRPRPWLPRRTP